MTSRRRRQRAELRGAARAAAAWTSPALIQSELGRAAGHSQLMAPPLLGRRSGGCGVRTRRKKQWHGGVDSGDGVAFRHAKLGEEGEATTAHPAVSIDPGKEVRCGEGTRRRRRGDRPSREREKGGGGF